MFTDLLKRLTPTTRRAAYALRCHLLSASKPTKVSLVASTPQAYVG